jgi:hypothetical protein
MRLATHSNLSNSEFFFSKRDQRSFALCREVAILKVPKSHLRPILRLDISTYLYMRILTSKLTISLVVYLEGASETGSLERFELPAIPSFSSNIIRGAQPPFP